MNTLAFLAFILLTGLALYIFLTCKHLFHDRRMTEDIFARIDDCLKVRHNFVNQLLQKADRFNLSMEEKQKLQDAVRRAEAAQDPHEKSSSEHMLSVLIKSELAKADLENHDGWKTLKQNFDQVDDQIQEARREYNQYTRIFNTRVEHFPANVFARVMGLKEKVFL